MTNEEIKVRLQKDLDKLGKYKWIPIIGKLMLVNMMSQTYLDIYRIEFDLSMAIMSDELTKQEIEAKEIYEEHLRKLERTLMYFAK